MKTLELNPNEIITLNDYPIHSDNILKKYIKKCGRGEKLAFVPVIRKEIAKRCLDTSLLREFKKFEMKHKRARYFMLDGGHRTTALTLAHCKIRAIIYEKDEDIKQARKLVSAGDILDSGTLKHNLEENCQILRRHFSNKPYFMTVLEKTQKMIDDGYVSN